MFAMWVVVIMAMVITGVSALNPKTSDIEREAAKTTATQMSTYHMQAVRMCTAPRTCSPGQINIVQQSGSNMQMVNLNAKFRSFYDGSVIVTTLTDAYTNVERAASYNGMISNALMLQTSYSVLAGPYDPTTMSVSAPSHQITIRYPDGHIEYPRGNLGTNLVSIPSNVAGLQLVANMPVIATPVF